MVVEKTALPSRVRRLGGGVRAMIGFGSWLGIASLVALLLTEAATRFGLSIFGPGSAIRFSAYTGAAAAVLTLLAGLWLLVKYRRRPSLLLIVGLLGGLAAFWVPYAAKMKAQRADTEAIAPTVIPTAPTQPGNAGR